MKKILILVALILVISGLSFIYVYMRDANSNQGWSTYVNNTYGYQISYPENVSVMTHDGTGLSLVSSNEDSVVIFVVKNSNDNDHEVIFPITVTNQKAETLDEAISLYKEHVIPNFVIDDENITVSDFVFEKVSLKETEALKIVTPTSIVYQVIGRDNTIIAMTILDTDNSNSLAREIVKTFKPTR